MKLICPKGCQWREEHPYPLFTAPSSLDTEQGIFVNEDGTLSNSFTDGIHGVTEDLKEQWEACDDMPHCVVCFSEAVRGR